MLGGCDNLSESPEFTKVLSGAEAVSRFAQKAVAGRTALAREYTDADLSAEFCANGTTLPNDPDYQRLAQNEFADWRLDVGGLDQRPGSFLLTEIKEIPSRTQITRHDCVEGWSCIGKWEGVRLAALLHLVGLRPTARRFACAMSGNSATRWPNTSMRIELVEDFARIGDGNGGYWEDQGYEWWAGI